MLADPIFWRALGNNIVYALSTIPLTIALALAMAIWVNGKIAGRPFLRLAFFTPTVLPMIAVANIWLFFYTPDYGLLDQILGLFGIPAHNWLGSPVDRAHLPDRGRGLEGGRLLHDLLSGGAAADVAGALPKRPRIEGAGRWYVFRRITFPLLMPTTLVRR